VKDCSPDIPETLLRQLTPGGRLVIPVGDKFRQELVRVRRRHDDRYSYDYLGEVRFVPLIGKEGWDC